MCRALQCRTLRRDGRQSTRQPWNALVPTRRINARTGKQEQESRGGEGVGGRENLKTARVVTPPDRRNLSPHGRGGSREPYPGREDPPDGPRRENKRLNFLIITFRGLCPYRVFTSFTRKGGLSSPQWYGWSTGGTGG